MGSEPRTISPQAIAMTERTAYGLCRLCAFYRQKPFLLCKNHMIAQRNRRRAGYAVRKNLGLCVTPKCSGKPGRFVRCEPCRKVIAAYKDRQKGKA